MDELLSRIRVKVWRSLRLYDVSRGIAFNFCAKIISSATASMVGENWRRGEHFTAFEEAYEAVTICDPVTTNEALCDMRHRVRQIKTPCTDAYELEAQRWLVDSFLDCEFCIRRHEAADSMSMV
jgi:hypothetical protein